jgi:hypothetical protein
LLPKNGLAHRSSRLRPHSKGFWLRYLRGSANGAVRVNPNRTPFFLCHSFPSPIHSQPLSSPTMTASHYHICCSSTCLTLVTSSGAESYPLALLPQCRSPSSITAAQQLGPAVVSHDPGAQPLPDGAVKWVNLEHLVATHTQQIRQCTGARRADFG